MGAFTSFYDWLVKKKNLRNSLGELAREVARDEAFPRDVASLDVLLEYMRVSSKSSAESVARARAAYRAYQRGEKTSYS
jgi:uncharacterized protein YozE (UPF0346 family)